MSEACVFQDRETRSVVGWVHGQWGAVSVMASQIDSIRGICPLSILNSKAMKFLSFFPGAQVFLPIKAMPGDWF